MNMSQKGFANIILIVSVVAFVAVAGYFVVTTKKQRQPATQQAPVQTTTPTPTETKMPAPTPPADTSSTQTNTGNGWKVFKNSRFTFQFSYPAEWSMLDQVDNAYGIDFWSAEKNPATRIMDFNSGINLSVVGISYCGAYPQDKRCESLKTESGGYVTIDWDVSGTANAMFSSQDGTYGVSFTLHKVNSETKNIFRKILSTFKFVASAQWIWENLGCGSSAPCSYRVCSTIHPKECYSCGGKYDRLSGEGEKTPEKNENPQTTTNFICRPAS